MLLKCTSAQKRIKSTGIGKPQRTASGMVRLGHGVSGLVTVLPKIHRRVVKAAGKRPSPLHHRQPVKREQIPVECENSNDSGLGFDQHLPSSVSAAHRPALVIADNQRVWTLEEGLPQVKRRRLEIKLESDDANDHFTFPVALRRPSHAHAPIACVRTRAPITLTSQLASHSARSGAQLVIACQPETQHRARYQTEGSRGAVKDRSGNGFPIVKLLGYDRPATLQVFIGTDQGRVAPHMFYQACRVSGKNSTPCVERKIDGTIVIEVDLEPSKDMIVTCDCVGILKERNVDVEHRFPEEGSGRSKKKSTRCRMVFRTTLTLPDGSQETLQAASQPIVCTQPPGVPEVSKKSLAACGARGGQELFILGKNFLKDTRVVFTDGEWRHSVAPDKEFLQQSHLVCVVPPYQQPDIAQPVTVRLLVESSNKSSEPHTFVYLPEPPAANAATNQVGSSDSAMASISVISQGGSTSQFTPLMAPVDPPATYIQPLRSPGRGEEKGVPVPVGLWDAPLMPPPPRPLAARRSSTPLIIPDQVATVTLEDELKRESSESDRYLRMVADLPRIVIPAKPVFPGESSNLLTTVESSPLPLPVAPPQAELPSSVIVNAAMLQKKAELKDELPSTTERLDAFVNSAAESHISPTPGAGLGAEPSEIKMLIPPTLSGDHVSPRMDRGAICSMLEPPVCDRAQTQTGYQNLNVGEVIRSPQLAPGNPPVFPDLRAAIDGQMPSLEVSCTTATAAEMVDMIPNKSQEQALSDIRASLEQHLSPPMIAGQIHSELNGLVQTSSHPQFRALQSAISQQMAAQALRSSHPDINGMLRAAQDTSPQTMTSTSPQPDIIGMLHNPQNMGPQAMTSSQPDVNGILHPVQNMASQAMTSPHPDINGMLRAAQNTASQAMTSPHPNIEGMLQITEETASQAMPSSHHEINVMLHPTQGTASQAMTSPHPDILKAMLHPAQDTASQSMTSHHPDIDGMLQTAQDSDVKRAQLMTEIRANLEQKFSPPQNPPSDAGLSGLMPSPHTTQHPVDILAQQKLGVTIDHSGLDGLLRSPPVNVADGQRDISNMQASFEQALADGMARPQPADLSMQGLVVCRRSPLGLSEPIPAGGGIELASQMQAATTQAHTLSTLHAISNHINSQVMTQSASGGGELQMGLGRSDAVITEHVHNQSVPPVTVVSQDQMLSNLQASIDQHLEAQSTCAETMMCSTAAAQNMIAQTAPGSAPMAPIDVPARHQMAPHPLSSDFQTGGTQAILPEAIPQGAEPVAVSLLRRTPPPELQQPSREVQEAREGGSRSGSEPKKGEPMPNINHLAQMSENDLISYINTSCFDSV